MKAGALYAIESDGKQVGNPVRCGSDGVLAFEALAGAGVETVATLEEEERNEDTLSSQIAGFVHPRRGTVEKDDSGIFYWIHECTKCSNISDAPLVVWLQGGPGASSLLGSLFEIGPLRFEEGAAAGSQPSSNPHAWNEKANLVFIDQPFGTGFSYGDSPTDMPGMAKWLRIAIEQLSAARPGHAGGARRPIWLTGESYAGKYIPYLATEIMSEGGELAERLRLGGLAIGDGWVNPELIVASYPEFSYAHGLVDEKQREAMEHNVTLFRDALRRGDNASATDIEHSIEHFVENVAGVNAYDVRHLGPYNFDAATGWWVVCLSWCGVFSLCVSN